MSVRFDVQQDVAVRLIGGPKDGWVYDRIGTHWDHVKGTKPPGYYPPTEITYGDFGSYWAADRIDEQGYLVYEWREDAQKREALERLGRAVG